MHRGLLVTAIVVMVFCVAAQSFALDIYTIKKDRVDQEVSGNRGYIMGTVPAYTDQRSTKRTLIAVDIELPSGSSSAAEKDTMEPVKRECPNPEVSMAPKKTVVIEEKMEEDDYIK